MKLNLGSGNYKLDWWKNIDIDPATEPDECYDISKGIKEDDNSVDEILLSHVLMYFTTVEVRNILKECRRVLKTGGVIRITEDNRHLKIRDDEQQKQYKNGVLFDRLEMRELLRYCGFTDIKDCEPFAETKQHLNLPKNYPLAKGRASVYFIKAINNYKKKTPMVYLGLDDFGETNSQMDILWRLRNYFDDFKVNLFAIPNDCLNLSWLRYINSIKWIKLCVHGYNHTHFEDLCPKTLEILTNKRANYFNKVYKAPYWELSKEMEKRLLGLNFTIVRLKDINWEIDVEPPDIAKINATGHIYPHDYKSEKGNIGTSLFWHYKNIMKLPKHTSFKHYD